MVTTRKPHAWMEVLTQTYGNPRLKYPVANNFRTTAHNVRKYFLSKNQTLGD